jgi:hypothetical protein
MSAEICRGVVGSLAVLACSAGGSEGEREEPKRPTFVTATGAPWPIGPQLGRPEIGDLNGDGTPDVVAACALEPEEKPPATGSRVAVLLGDGKGGFGRSAGLVLDSGPPVHAVALGDVDEDGKLDALAIAHDALAVHVLLGDGKGALAAAPGSPFSTASGIRPHTHAVALADVNGDRHLDALTTNADGDSVSVLLGDGRARFAPAEGSPFAAGRHPYASISVADLDGDGDLDLVVPSIHANEISVLANDGKGSFAELGRSPFAVGPRPGYAAVVDLDHEAGLDIVATHDDDALLAVLISDGEGGYYAGKGALIELPERAWSIAGGDLDRDGRCDIVLGTHGANGPMILFGDGAGGFGPPKRVERPVGRAPGYAVLADLDLDGALDIVAASFESGDLAAYLSRD